MILNKTTEWPVSMVRIQSESTKPTAMTVMNLTNKYNCCTKRINQNIPLNLIHKDLHTKQQYTVPPTIHTQDNITLYHPNPWQESSSKPQNGPYPWQESRSN